MEEKKKEQLFMNMEMLREQLVPWSKDTVIRKIKTDGFPAIQDKGGQYMFKRTDVMLWFKRREVIAG